MLKYQPDKGMKQTRTRKEFLLTIGEIQLIVKFNNKLLS